MKIYNLVNIQSVAKLLVTFCSEDSKVCLSTNILMYLLRDLDKYPQIEFNLQDKRDIYQVAIRYTADRFVVVINPLN